MCSSDLLNKFNKHFRYNFTPPGKGKYTVYIPIDKIASFKQNYNESEALKQDFVIYTVKRGDTITSIAKKYNTKVEAIISVNEIKNLKPNQKILVPVAKTKSYSSVAFGMDI